MRVTSTLVHSPSSRSIFNMSTLITNSLWIFFFICYLIFSFLLNLRLTLTLEYLIVISWKYEMEMVFLNVNHKLKFVIKSMECVLWLGNIILKVSVLNGTMGKIWSLYVFFSQGSSYLIMAFNFSEQRFPSLATFYSGNSVLNW